MKLQTAAVDDSLFFRRCNNFQVTTGWCNCSSRLPSPLPLRTCHSYWGWSNTSDGVQTDDQAPKTLLHSCLIKWEASWPGADKSPHTFFFFFFFFKYIIFLQIFIQSLFLTLLVRPASSDLQPHVLPFSLLPSTFVLPVMTLVILDRFLHYPVFPLSFSCAHHFFPLHCLFTYASPPTPLTCFRCIEGEIRGFWSKTTQLLPWSA